MASEFTTHRDLFAGIPRITFRDRSGKHQQWNARFPKPRAYAEAEFMVGPDANRYLQVHLEEGHEKSSRVISVTLSEERGRELLAYLKERYGDVS